MTRLLPIVLLFVTCVVSLCPAEEASLIAKSLVASVRPSKATPANSTGGITVEIKNSGQEPVELTTIRGRDPFRLTIKDGAGNDMDRHVGSRAKEGNAPASLLCFEPGEAKAFEARLTARGEQGQENKLAPGIYTVVATVPVVTKHGGKYSIARVESPPAEIEVK
jgi:hypothetical protein